MDASELEQFKKQLIELETELRELVESSKDSSKPVILDQTAVGRLSRMDAMQGQEMALESARRRQRQIAKIDGALRRIESGDYGYCVVCGEEIDKRRLALDPTHTRCMLCVEK